MANPENVSDEPQDKPKKMTLSAMYALAEQLSDTTRDQLGVHSLEFKLARLLFWDIGRTGDVARDVGDLKTEVDGMKKKVDAALIAMQKQVAEACNLFAQAVEDMKSTGKLPPDAAQEPTETPPTDIAVIETESPTKPTIIPPLPRPVKPPRVK